MDNLKFIGYIIKNQGLEGFIKVLLKYKYHIYFEKINFIFLKMDGLFIPYRLEKLNVSGNYLMIKLKNFQNVEDIKKLKGLELFIDNTFLEKTNQTTLERVNLIGYEVYDNVLGKVGKIIDTIDNNTNKLLVIQKADKEALIPLVSPLVIEVDESKQYLITDLPEGLLDIND